jgi:hypothetical protein
MQQVCRMPIIFNLLKHLLIWVMSFVEEDVNQPLPILYHFSIEL